MYREIKKNLWKKNDNNNTTVLTRTGHFFSVFYLADSKIVCTFAPSYVKTGDPRTEKSARLYAELVKRNLENFCSKVGIVNLLYACTGVEYVAISCYTVFQNLA